MIDDDLDVDALLDELEGADVGDVVESLPQRPIRTEEFVSRAE